MLHTLRYSPTQFDMTARLASLKAGDALLLIEDGVLAAVTGSVALQALRATPASLFALSPDIEARGLSAYISHNITCVDYAGFVKLVTQHAQQFAW